VTPYIAAESTYLGAVFWIAVTVLQSGSRVLFPPAVTLLTATLSRMADCHVLGGGVDLATTLMALRCSSDEESEAASELDGVSGVNFGHDFAFSLASLLVKGLKTATVQVETVYALKLLLQLSAQPSPIDRRRDAARLGGAHVGYFISLLPAVARQIDSFTLDDLFAMSGMRLPQINGHAPLNDGAPRALLPLLDLSSNEAHLLVASLVVAFIRAPCSDPEKTLYFGFLAEISAVSPVIVAMLCARPLSAFCRLSD
jgi:neurofibromin 1